MHTLPVRIALLALLVASGIAAAYFLNDIDRRAGALAVAERETAAGVVRIAGVVNGIGSAQQSYVAPGQPDEPLFERVSALVKQLYDETAALRPALRSPDAHRALQSITEATDGVIAADTRARENLRLGQELMAADVLFSDGRSTLDGMTARLDELGQAERSAIESEQAALAGQRWTVLGGVAATWLAGLLALVFIRPARKDAANATSLESIGSSSTALLGRADSSPLDGLRSPAVDLKAAADLCTALSRVTATAALPALLGRAATLLDAPGIILWMGAGDELFAVTAHGYGPQIIARLGPIGRAADNATAAAWRTGEIATVPGDASGHGAIVAPMFGPDACIGALAIEVRNGREEDPVAQAVASMIAAQLATAVSAWPAASAPAPVEESAAVAADRARSVARQLAREFRSAGM